MEFYFLKKTDIKDAIGYIPIMEKQKIIDDIAPKCILDLPVKADDKPMPSMYGEDTFMKSRYLMGILLHCYFEKDIDPVEKEKYLLAADDYDRWAKNHIFNELERMKSDSEVRDKVFDILYDYKDFEKKLNAQIYMLLNVMNDPCTRILAMVESQSTPEAIKEAFNKMNEAKDNFTKAFEKKGGTEK